MLELAAVVAVGASEEVEAANLACELLNECKRERGVREGGSEEVSERARVGGASMRECAK